MKATYLGHNEAVTSRSPDGVYYHHILGTANRLQVISVGVRLDVKEFSETIGRTVCMVDKHERMDISPECPPEVRKKIKERGFFSALITLSPLDHISD